MTKKRRQRNRQNIKPKHQTIGKWYYVAGILLLTILVYSNSIHNDFIYQFDDDLYVTNNPDIQAITGENLKSILTKPYVGLYLPLTMFVYMIEYQLFGMNPAPYHLVNLLIHLVNTLLVFLLIYKIKPHIYIASVVAFVFAVHPMHVESVSWISELKDVLFTMFYLAGLLTYLRYIQKNRSKDIWLTAGYFILSLFSKTLAVSFPLFLVLFDWYYGRLFNRKVIFEKVPFFTLSLIMGLTGIYFTQVAGASDTSTPDIPWIHRPFIVADAVLMYLYKFIAPVKLAIYHYYPDISKGVLPARFYISTGILFALTLTAIIWVVRTGEKKRDLIFGLAFFIIPTLFVLQLVPAGRAYAAERYTYLSYCGLAYIFAIFTYPLISKQQRSYPKKFLVAGLIIFAAGFSILTYQRNKDWSDSITLFTDLIEKKPGFGHPYLIRGITYVQLGKPELALTDYNRSLELDPDNPKTLANRSSAKGMTGDYEGALKDATRALEMQPNDQNALVNRANARIFLKDFEGARADCSALIAIDSTNAGYYQKRIIALKELNDHEALLKDYLALSALEPENHLHPALAGEVAYILGKYKKAIELLSRSMKLKPGYYQPLFVRGNAWYNLGEYRKALADYTRYAGITNNSMAYFNIGQCHFQLQEIPKACTAWQKALELGHEDAQNQINNYCR